MRRANNCHNAANYGWLVNRVRSLVSPLRSKPVWAFVEDNCPFGDAGWPCITGAQLRAAVWHSFIAGARGVVYFNHSFKANGAIGCGTSQHTLRTALRCGRLSRARTPRFSDGVRSELPDPDDRDEGHRKRQGDGQVGRLELLRHLSRYAGSGGVHLSPSRAWATPRRR